jgi:hypothetical protein
MLLEKCGVVFVRNEKCLTVRKPLAVAEKKRSHDVNFPGLLGTLKVVLALRLCFTRHRERVTQSQFFRRATREKWRSVEVDEN